MNKFIKNQWKSVHCLWKINISSSVGVHVCLSIDEANECVWKKRDFVKRYKITKCLHVSKTIVRYKTMETIFLFVHLPPSICTAIHIISSCMNWKKQPFTVSRWEYEPLLKILHINFASLSWLASVTSLSSSHFWFHWSIRYHETPITCCYCFRLPCYTLNAFPLTSWCFLISSNFSMQFMKNETPF